jgi:hypothetical protein
MVSPSNIPSSAASHFGTLRRVRRCSALAEHAMADNNGKSGTFGLILGGLVVAAAAIFILTCGELGGEKKIKGDADLPPVASTAPAKK